LEQYRYGFNGKEKDPEGMGGGGATYDYGFRIYNPQIAKFLSVDPLTKDYPYYTPYQYAGNTPIWAIDIDGLEMGIQSYIQGIQSEQLSEKYGKSPLYYRAEIAKTEAKAVGVVGGVAAVYFDVKFNKAKITVATMKEVVYQVIAITIMNGGNVEQAVNEVDAANAIIKGVFKGTGIDKLNQFGLPVGKLAEEALKSAFDLNMAEGFNSKLTEEQFGEFSQKLFYRMGIDKLSKQFGLKDALGEPVEDVFKKVLRGILTDMNLFGIEEYEIPQSTTEFNINDLNKRVPAQTDRVSSPVIKVNINSQNKDE
jgi:RHS repeat-associated protein